MYDCIIAERLRQLRSAGSEPVQLQLELPLEILDDGPARDSVREPIVLDMSGRRDSEDDDEGVFILEL